MVTTTDPTHISNGLSAVTRRFPQYEFAIRKLMLTSECFRDMCDELADAEVALANAAATPAEVRSARQVEWQQIVDRLVGEIAAELEESQERWKRSGI